MIYPSFTTVLMPNFFAADHDGDVVNYTFSPRALDSVEVEDLHDAGVNLHVSALDDVPSSKELDELIKEIDWLGSLDIVGEI
jgi:hypothetical protein